MGKSISIQRARVLNVWALKPHHIKLKIHSANMIKHLFVFSKKRTALIKDWVIQESKLLLKRVYILNNVTGVKFPALQLFSFRWNFSLLLKFTSFK